MTRIPVQAYCLQRKRLSVHINQALYCKNAKNLCEEQCKHQCETFHKTESPCSHSVYTEDVTLFTPKTAWCLHRNHRTVHINWRLRMTQWLATELREIRRALLVDHTVYIVKQGGVLNTPKVAKSAQKRRKSLKIKDFCINLMGFCFNCFRGYFAVVYNSVNDQ